MNRIHHWLCSSNRWRLTVQQRVPWVIGDLDLGLNVLELGPGPGLTTELLCASVPRLTALEIDSGFAASLRSRLQASQLRVVEADATAMPFENAQFSAVVSFTMLHHVPSPALQDKLITEVFRVLRPGGFFLGSDSLQSWWMRIIHIGDTLVPVDPDTFGARLQSAGFNVFEIQRNSEAFRFRAQRPAAPDLRQNKRQVSANHKETPHPNP